jgi:hypothetical protein
VTLGVAVTPEKFTAEAVVNPIPNGPCRAGKKNETPSRCSAFQASTSASSSTLAGFKAQARHRRAQTQKRENNPMQSRMGPGPRSTRAVLRPGHEKKNDPSSRPNLISSRSNHPAEWKGASPRSTVAAQTGKGIARKSMMTTANLWK